MIKKFFLNLLDKVAIFLSNKIRNRTQPKSPSDFYLEEISKECYEFFKEDFKNSRIFSNDNSIRKYSINRAINNFKNDGLFLEFGVYKGDSINLFASILKNVNASIHGFDSFKGLKDEWLTDEYHPTGTFDVKGKKPKVLKNVNLIEGWVEDTLDNFLNSINSDKVSFIHLDMDTYKSTAFVLKKLENYFKKGTIVLFDEYYGFPNWEKYEYKALQEILKKENYKYIAFGTRQACIEII